MAERMTIDTDYLIAPEPFDLTMIRLEANGLSPTVVICSFQTPDLGFEGSDLREIRSRSMS
jgi:hypothetical protein